MVVTSGNILVVEDDVELNRHLANLVSDAGYRAESCFDGQSALLLSAKENYDLVLLDLNLPQLNGLTLLSMLRMNSRVPIIVITGQGTEQDRINGLSQGADDYVVKPFNNKELLLRIEAILSRCRVEQTSKVMEKDVHGLVLQLNQKRACFSGRDLSLTPVQFKLLWELAVHHGKVLTKAYLYQRVLNRSIETHDRSLDMHLSRIRRKLKEVSWLDDHLQTVHGKGYCLK